MYFNSVFNLSREALTLILTSYLQILNNEKKNKKLNNKKNY